jgi:hypothetical protein
MRRTVFFIRRLLRDIANIFLQKDWVVASTKPWNRFQGIDSWRAGMTNRVIVTARQAAAWRNQFLVILG